MPLAGPDRGRERNRRLGWVVAEVARPPAEIGRCVRGRAAALDMRRAGGLRRVVAHQPQRNARNSVMETSPEPSWTTAAVTPRAAGAPRGGA